MWQKVHKGDQIQAENFFYKTRVKCGKNWCQFAKKNLAPGDVAGAYVAAGDVAGGDVAPGDDRSCIPSVVWWVALVWYIWWEIFSHDKHQNARASVASVKKW